jgi:sugar lactone lactonase YvrE
VAPKDSRPVAIPANAAAIDRLIWSPGLDEGWIPQGLTVAEGSLIVATYRAKTAERAGGCRLYRIDPAKGAETGRYDVGGSCGHGGGLAYLGANRLLLADTGTLFDLDMAAAFKNGRDAVRRKILLSGALRGSFLAERGGIPWVGLYNRNGESRIFIVPKEKLTAARINDKEVTGSLALPQQAQGAAFDGAGMLWVSASSSSFGRLYRIDPKDGAVLASYDMPAGIEDLGFDGDGRLWAVSEAGAGPYRHWATYFPVIFRIDVSKLK